MQDRYPNPDCYKCPHCKSKRLLDWILCETSTGRPTRAIQCENCGVTGPRVIDESDGHGLAEVAWNEFAKKWATSMTVDFDRGRIFGLSLSRKLLSQGFGPSETLGIVESMISFLEGDFTPVKGLDDAQS